MHYGGRERQRRVNATNPNGKRSRVGEETGIGPCFRTMSGPDRKPSTPKNAPIPHRPVNAYPNVTAIDHLQNSTARALTLLFCPFAGRPESFCAGRRNDRAAETAPDRLNSWNWFAKAKINEGIVREVIEAMATNGMKDAGYTHVVVDRRLAEHKLNRKK